MEPNSSPTQLLSSLRSIRNSVIGSRTKKSNLASHGLIPYFSALLIYPLPTSKVGDDLQTAAAQNQAWSLDDSLEIRGLAATIVGSIAHGEYHIVSSDSFQVW